MEYTGAVRFNGLSRCYVVLACALWCLMLVVWAPAHALGETPRGNGLDASLMGDASVNLTPFSAALEDPTATMTLADAQKAAGSGRFLVGQSGTATWNFGMGDSAYWVRMEIRNTAGQPTERWLQVSESSLSRVDLYPPSVGSGAGAIATGMSRPFASRPYANHTFVFPLTLPAHSEGVYYLRVQSGAPVAIPLQLWTPQAFRTHERLDYAAYAWYFGMATAMALFNLMLWLALRDGIYLSYVAFIGFTALGFAAQYGLAQEFLWPNATLWSDISHFSLYGFAIASGLMFLRKLLSVQQILPCADRYLNVLAGFLVLTPLGYWVSYQSFGKLTLPLILLSATTVLVVGLIAVYKRQRNAAVFVMAFVAFLAGVIAVGLRGLGLLPTNILTTNGHQIGSVLEMFLLAFALADRFFVMRREVEQSQALAFQSQQRLVESLQQSERLLEERVAQRTEELSRLNAQLEALNALDALTGIANRRRFDEALRNEWQRAVRTHQPIALGMLDVDFFKQYNDHYGHPAGDACLQRVAQELAKAVCRVGDLVARYGGEEFVFIAPATDAEAAVQLAEKVRGAIAACDLPHALSDKRHVTVSIGVVSLVPTELDGHDRCLKMADQALYQAKAGGRDRVCLADPSGGSRLQQ